MACYRVFIKKSQKICLGVHLGKFRFICIIFVLFSVVHLDYLTLNFHTYQKVILGKQLILGVLSLSKLHPHIYIL
ncbi:hypothetical protein BT93_E1721 [Corymbia citriodora subsp. variegata]|nr:hypothetical protein BT93_E1721 [Corymbia citriodora subsp. variegata]